MFGGGNFDADDMDDWLVIQRDMKVDAGMVPVTEAQVLETRTARGEGDPGRVRRAWLSDDQRCGDRGGRPRPMHRTTCPSAISSPISRRRMGCSTGRSSAVDVIKALDATGFTDIAANILGMQRARVIGDYLQPAAILDKNFKVESAFSDPNDYRGPGSGFRLEGEEWRADRRYSAGEDARAKWCRLPTARRA